MLLEIIKVALSSLRTNKLRSGLTVLGIIVGIFSIISISTVIAMLQKSIEEGVSVLGKNTFQIQKWPAVHTGGPENWAKIRNRKDISYEDYLRVKDKLMQYSSVGAEQWGRGRLAKYRNKKTNPNLQFCGLTPEAFLNNDWMIKQGRDINFRDLKSYNKVVVIGEDVKDALFEPYENPIGKEISIDGNKWKVVGILESRSGGIFGRNEGTYMFVPITAYQSIYGDSRSINITVRVYDGSQYNNVIEQADGLMRTIRKVPPGEERDFDIFSNTSLLTQINEITKNVKLGAYVIGLIALLAAGIGIMNIMLVSVTERTMEIGIRKAVGAKKVNILVQFVSEAIVLCLIGGLIGIVVGVGVGNLAGSLLQATAVIPMDWVMIGILLCTLIGITFGTYPAVKAANLDPIDALRYE